jgi:hypothetical protein
MVKAFAEAKREAENIFKIFGWLSVLDRIVQSNRFTKNGLTPLQSARASDAIEAFTFIALENKTQ